MESGDEDRVFLSVISVAELRYGVERMAAGARRHRLELWLREELPLRFEGRMFPIDGQIAQAWGNVVAHADKAGRPISVMDAFLAATAEVHHLTLITRNVSHFSALRAVLNPWS